MIIIIIDITNEIITRLKNDLSSVAVLNSYQNTTAKFPTIVVEEVNNKVMSSTRDSSGFNHSIVSLRINIFTTGNKKVSDSKSLRNTIDDMLSGEYGMYRVNAQQVTNYLDDDIYRYVIDYNFTIDKNKVIWR